MNPILKSIINKQRSDFGKLSAGRHIPDKVFDGVYQARGIRYKQDGDPAHVMDMYCPNTVKIPTPVVINVHGGGLIMGNKEFNRHFCINLSKMGFIVFSVEYRLCPEVSISFHRWIFPSRNARMASGAHSRSDQMEAVT